MTIEGESLGASWETLSGATAKISGMGAGVQAVKQKLNSGFEPIEFREMYDMNADSTSIVFESHGQVTPSAFRGSSMMISSREPQRACGIW
jgi:hypothetical protein